MPFFELAAQVFRGLLLLIIFIGDVQRGQNCGVDRRNAPVLVHAPDLAVHMGGATQILFGITGKRWENKYDNTVGKLINEHWVRPMASERPKGAEKVEGGCYW